jgi:acetyl/propionyl-CoA carboxylase alpha subunit
MAEALTRTAILGVTTNLALLRAIVAHPEFVAGALHTGFIDDHLADLPRPECPPARILSAALLASRRRTAGGGGAAGKTVPDPWGQVGAWRLGA